MAQADRICQAAECTRDEDEVEELVRSAQAHDAADLRDRCNAIRRRARGTEDHDRVRRARMVRAWIDPDGAGNILLRTTADEFAAAMAAIEAEAASRVRRSSDRSVTPDNHAADGMVDLLCGHRRRRDHLAPGRVEEDLCGDGLVQQHADGSLEFRDDDGSVVIQHPDGTLVRHRDGQLLVRRPIADTDTDAAAGGDRWASSTRHDMWPQRRDDHSLGADPPPDSFGWGRCPTCGHDNDPVVRWRRATRPKAVLRVDLGALARGRRDDGEVCEIAGYGPIAVDAMRDVLSDAAIAIICTDGVDVVNVTNLSRRHTAAQTSALQWLLPGRCTVDGCQNSQRVEWDHITEYVQSQRTTIGDTQGLCEVCHDKKTLGHDHRLN